MDEKQEEASRIIEAIGTTTLCYVPVMGSSSKVGDIVKDKEGDLYEILSFSNSLFLILKDLKTKELVISSAEYYCR